MDAWWPGLGCRFLEVRKLIFLASSSLIFFFQIFYPPGLLRLPILISIDGFASKRFGFLVFRVRVCMLGVNGTVYTNKAFINEIFIAFSPFFYDGGQGSRWSGLGCSACG